MGLGVIGLSLAFISALPSPQIFFELERAWIGPAKNPSVLNIHLDMPSLTSDEDRIGICYAVSTAQILFDAWKHLVPEAMKPSLSEKELEPSAFAAAVSFRAHYDQDERQPVRGASISGGYIYWSLLANIEDGLLPYSQVDKKIRASLGFKLLTKHSWNGFTEFLQNEFLKDKILSPSETEKQNKIERMKAALDSFEIDLDETKIESLLQKSLFYPFLNAAIRASLPYHTIIKFPNALKPRVEYDNSPNPQDRAEEIKKILRDQKSWMIIAYDMEKLWGNPGVPGENIWPRDHSSLLVGYQPASSLSGEQVLLQNIVANYKEWHPLSKMADATLEIAWLIFPGDQNFASRFVH